MTQSSVEGKFRQREKGPRLTLAGEGTDDVRVVVPDPVQMSPDRPPASSALEIALDGVARQRCCLPHTSGGGTHFTRRESQQVET